MNDKNIWGMSIVLTIVIIYALLIQNTEALNLTYQGDKRLCITENNGSITCLEKGKLFDYNVNKDYIIELTEKVKEKNFKNLIDFFIDNMLAFGFTMILFMFISWGLYYFIVN